jgi:hypothetical protein
VELLSVIRRWRYRDHFPIREISRRTGLSRNTVRKYLRSDCDYARSEAPTTETYRLCRKFCLCTRGVNLVILVRPSSPIDKICDTIRSLLRRASGITKQGGEAPAAGCLLFAREPPCDRERGVRPDVSPALDRDRRRRPHAVLHRLSLPVSARPRRPPLLGPDCARRHRQGKNAYTIGSA